MIYKIEINFTKGPSFSTEVKADSESQARTMVLAAARNWGFTNKVKKMIVRSLA